MNKRIKELKQAAGIDFNPDQEGLDLFAQLIVRECSELTLDHKNDDYYNGWLDYRDEIKQHFGVEE
jgi:hypothetical protein